jgi:hypothetical protein
MTSPGRSTAYRLIVAMRSGIATIVRSEAITSGTAALLPAAGQISDRMTNLTGAAQED